MNEKSAVANLRRLKRPNRLLFDCLFDHLILRYLGGEIWSQSGFDRNAPRIFFPIVPPHGLYAKSFPRNNDLSSRKYVSGTIFGNNKEFGSHFIIDRLCESQNSIICYEGRYFSSTVKVALPLMFIELLQRYNLFNDLVYMSEYSKK